MISHSDTDLLVKISEDLRTRAKAGAERTGVSIDAFVSRALLRELDAPAAEHAPSSTASDLIAISEVARMLCLSVCTIRRRSRKAGDPIRLARSKVGPQKPMHFIRSRIEQIERA